MYYNELLKVKNAIIIGICLLIISIAPASATQIEESNDSYPTNLNPYSIENDNIPFKTVEYSNNTTNTDIIDQDTLIEGMFGVMYVICGGVVILRFIHDCFIFPSKFGQPSAFSLNICENLRENTWLNCCGIIVLIIMIIITVQGIQRIQHCIKKYQQKNATLIKKTSDRITYIE